MKTICSLVLASVVMTLASCTHETYYYRTTRTTSYRSSPSPTTTLPGQAYKLPNPDAPSSFKAESN